MLCVTVPLAHDAAQPLSPSLRFASRSNWSALRILLLHLLFAMSQPRLRTCSSRTTLVRKTCDLSAGAAGARYTFCTYNLRMSCRSCGSALRVLTKHRFASKENRKVERRHSESASTEAFAWRHSGSASTGRISAEGSPRARRIQRERFDTHNLCRGLAESNSESASTRAISAKGSPSKTNSHGATARALRHAQSLQRACREQDEFARRHSESAFTHRISAEGSPTARQIRTTPQREYFDTHNLRRGFVESKTNSHGATARAL